MQALPRRRPRVLRLAAIAFAGGLILSVAPVLTPSFVASATTDVASLTLPTDVGADELSRQRAEAELSLDDDRLSGVASHVEAFEALGVVLDAVPEEPVLVRVRTADDSWSDWTELEVEIDHGPDQGSEEALSAVPQGAAITEPYWVGDADGYEVSVGARDASDVEVALVREERRRVIAEAVPLADAAAAPFPIGSRSSWGARGPRRSASTASSLKLAVVHHTVTPNGYSQSKVPSILRSLQAYHMDILGWSDVGYNFFVDRFGGVWEGRRGSTQSAVVGGHSTGFNTGSVGVAVIGTYTSGASSAAAREGVGRVVGYRLQAYGRNPLGTVTTTSLGSSKYPNGRRVTLPVVVGHVDVAYTGCPGTIAGSLGSIRSRARDWYLWMNAITMPVGVIDSMTARGDRIDVVGWAKDPGGTGLPARVHVVTPGRLREVFASGYRADVAAEYVGHADTGFVASFDGVPRGTHRVCVTVINRGEGSDKLLGCRDVVVK